MNLDLDRQLVEAYRSSSQKVRVLTEDWVNKEIYCPSCGTDRLQKYANNRPVADFFCPGCKEDFELKSKKDAIGTKIVDGAYQTMMERLVSVDNPNFFLLNYDLSSFSVLNFIVVPKHFFVPDVIEKRRPLSSTARRAGWRGCNILLQKIPQSGRIFLVRDTKVEPKEKVLIIWQKTLFLREEKKVEAKGWILDVIRCIEFLDKKEFKLADIYKYELMLAKQHPENRHIKDKIRQQLQILRDRKYLEFISPGEYRII